MLIRCHTLAFRDSNRGHGHLVKMQILNPKVKGGAWDSALLASTQVMPAKQVQGPHCEQRDLSALPLALTCQHF